MAGELEYAEHAEHAERDERTGHIVVVGDTQPDVVRQYGHHVDDAHHAAHELAPVRGGEQPEQVLGGEYHDACGVQAEKDDLVAFAARQCAHAAGPVAARHRLHHVGHDRNGDEEAGDIVEDERSGGRVRVAERAPHLLSDVGELRQVLVAVLRQLVVHQPFRVLTLPVPIVLVAAVTDHVRQYAEERQLLVVAGQALVLRIVQLAGPVIVEYVPEYVRVPVKEILLAVLVVEELALVGPEQRVRILFHRVTPRLEPAAGHVDQKFLVVDPPPVLGHRRRRQRVRGDGHPTDGRRPGERQPSGDRGHAVRRNDSITGGAASAGPVAVRVPAAVAVLVGTVGTRVPVVVLMRRRWPTRGA